MKFNATRMELLRLRKRLALARKGHKLLKDKQDELIRHFLGLVREAKTLREKMEKAFETYYRAAMAAQCRMPESLYETAVLVPAASVELVTEERRILNIRVPVFTVEITGSTYPYGFDATNSSLDRASDELRELLPVMIKLAEVERAVTLLSEEIEKVRRRVNALEHKLIPTFEDAIYEITMRLDEFERSNLVRLMKVKELIAD
jgi:V/A-type H+-transporting ATPase subunit D